MLASALAVSSYAAGPPAYGPPAYAPQGYAPAPYKEEKLAPQPYAYQYGVNDDYSNSHFQKEESQDAEGRVSGRYSISLPDGRVQITTYTADHVNGYIADVTYEGTAVYPPEPKEGYGYKPAYNVPKAAYPARVAYPAPQAYPQPAYLN